MNDCDHWSFEACALRAQEQFSGRETPCPYCERDALRTRLAEAKALPTMQEVYERGVHDGAHSRGPEIIALMEQRDALAARLAEAEALLREWPDALHWSTWRAWKARRDAFLAADSAPAVMTDTDRINWLEQTDGRFYNLDRVTAIVGRGFKHTGRQVPNDWDWSLRSAIDAAMAPDSASEEGE